MTRDPLELFTVKDAAKFLKVSETTIYRLIRDRRLAYRKAGSQIRFTFLDLEDFIRIERTFCEFKPSGKPSKAAKNKINRKVIRSLKKPIKDHTVD